MVRGRVAAFPPQIIDETTLVMLKEPQKMYEKL